MRSRKIQQRAKFLALKVDRSIIDVREAKMARLEISIVTIVEIPLLCKLNCLYIELVQYILLLKFKLLNLFILKKSG